MTDNEIIKALECCTYTSDWNMRCSECPFSNSINCRVLLATNALTLITSQQAEIERLRDMVSANEGVLPQYEQLIKAEAIQEFAERLRKRVSGVGVHNAIDCIEREMVGDGDG